MRRLLIDVPLARCKTLLIHSGQTAGLAALAGLDASTLPIVPQGRLAVPWTGMRKFIAIGLNYADHAAEANMPIPQEPIVFTKTVDSAVGCNHPVVLPQGSVKSDGLCSWRGRYF